MSFSAPLHRLITQISCAPVSVHVKPSPWTADLRPETALKCRLRVKRRLTYTAGVIQVVRSENLYLVSLKSALARLIITLVILFMAIASIIQIVT